MSRLVGRTAIATVLVLLAGCSWSSEPSTGLASLGQLPHPSTTGNPPPTTPTTTTPAQRECSELHLQTKSYAPPGGPQDVGPVAELRRRGYLLVGVDENTLGLSSRNPNTGEFSGFEVDIAKEIAKDLFGESYTDDSVHLVPVVTDDKFKVVQNGTVDMTIDANSMTCARWGLVAFSAEYYTAEQKFLVRQDSSITTRGDLRGKRVCVTAGSSSSVILHDELTEVTPVPEAARTDCLLRLQDGTVDAYFGHDSFLAGMLPQDRDNIEIRTVDLPGVDTTSHYGIAIAQNRIDLVRFVNGVLQRMSADGTWDQLYAKLQATLPDLPTGTQPLPAYRDSAP